MSQRTETNTAIDAPEPANTGTDKDVQRTVDRVLAFIVTFIPPAAFLLAMWLWYTGWYQPGWTEIGILLTMQFLPLMGVELGFHRLFAHRSYKASTPIKILWAVLGSMAFQGPVIWWASIHRKHHKYSDQQGDPHSMWLSGDREGELTFRGMVHAHVGWIWSAASVGKGGFAGYARDLYQDPHIFWIHMHYAYFLVASFTLPTIAGGLIDMSWKGAFLGFLYGGFVRIFVTNHLTYWCINSVTHGVGGRTYPTDDHSTNVPWLAPLTWGQSWHNNHHAFPYAAFMDHRWWQFDPGGLVLRALEKLGLVSDLRFPTPEQLQRKQQGSFQPAGRQT